MLARAERDTTVVLLDRPRYFTNAAEYAPDYTVLSDNCTRWWPTSAWWRRTADCSTPVTWLGWRRRSSSLRALHSGHIGLVHRAGGSGCTAHKLLSARIDGKRNGNKRSADRLGLRAERCFTAVAVPRIGCALSEPTPSIYVLSTPRQERQRRRQK